jgi:hypothetical protein
VGFYKIKFIRMKKISGSQQNKEIKENVSRKKRKIKIPINDVKSNKKEIIAHFEKKQIRHKILRTTRTPSGQVLDWIDINSQVDGKIATPPPEPELLGLVRGKYKHTLTKFELDDPDVERGPAGTVPILRKDLKHISFKKPLRRFLSKSGRKTYPLRISDQDEVEMPVDGGHDYAYTSQFVDCFGGESNLSAYDPYTNWSDEFSLLQIAMARGSGKQKQTVEGGWQEYKDIYGDWVPHLFVYYTTNGYSNDDDNQGGYNRDVDGWVQYSDSVYPGAVSSPNSTRGGAQFIMQIKYQLWQGNWWFCCNGKWLGYYPGNLFNASGLQNKAEKMALYGEIVDSDDHSGETNTDMGSGYWPEWRWPYSGYISNARYQSGAQGQMTDYNGTSWASDPDMYDLETHMLSGSSWGSYFWLGGPGAG